MTHRLGIEEIILLLAGIAGVLSVGIIVWAVLNPVDHPAGPSADHPVSPYADQLDQEIQLKPPPAYEIADESDSSAFSCEPEVEGYYLSGCSMILTEATGAKKLASIIEDTPTNPHSPGLFVRTQFLDKSEFATGWGDTIATSYCFERKDVAVSALGSALGRAELLGKTDKCYVAIYRDDIEALKPAIKKFGPPRFVD